MGFIRSRGVGSFRSIAGDQLLKLMSLGLTEKQAVDTILTGFLR